MDGDGLYSPELQFKNVHDDPHSICTKHGDSCHVCVSVFSVLERASINLIILIFFYHSLNKSLRLKKPLHVGIVTDQKTG
jgi:hypothetical protein